MVIPRHDHSTYKGKRPGKNSYGPQKRFNYQRFCRKDTQGFRQEFQDSEIIQRQKNNAGRIELQTSARRHSRDLRKMNDLRGFLLRKRNEIIPPKYWERYQKKKD